MQDKKIFSCHSGWLHFQSKRGSQITLVSASFKRFFFFFYNVRVVNLTLKDDAALVIHVGTIFWQKARILRRTDHCFDKLLKLWDQRKGLQKSLTRTTGSEKRKRELFMEKMDDLFNIALSDA